MGQIKSALEKALERTADIEGDKSGLEARANRETGMKLLVKYEQQPDFDLKAALAAYKGEQLTQVIAGLRQNLDGIINLPANEEAFKRFERLVPVMLLLGGNHEAIQDYLGQLGGFFTKYLQSKAQMLEAAKQQYEPALRQKEEAMARQSGRKVQLRHEQDPEFGKFLNQNMEALNAQFLRVLEPIQAEIKGILDAS